VRAPRANAIANASSAPSAANARPDSGHQPATRCRRATRIRTPLQRSPPTPHPGAGCALTTTPPRCTDRDPQRPTTRPRRRPTPRISAGRVACTGFRAPTGGTRAPLQVLTPSTTRDSSKEVSAAWASGHLRSSDDRSA
jgi:hypothetical protein